MAKIILTTSREKPDITLRTDIYSDLLYDLAKGLQSEEKDALTPAKGQKVLPIVDQVAQTKVSSKPAEKREQINFKIESSSFDAVLAKAASYANAPTSIEYYMGGTQPKLLTKNSIVSSGTPGFTERDDGSAVLQLEVDPAKFGSRFVNLSLVRI